MILLQKHTGHDKARRFFTPDNSSSYDSVVRFTTLGRDYVWKKKIIEMIEKETLILDLACGTGILSSLIAFSNNTRKVVGLDLIFPYLESVKKKTDKISLMNGTAEILPYKNKSFGSVVSSYLAKYVNIEMVVAECWRVLEDNGTVVFHDFTFPQNTVIRHMWRAYFLILRSSGLLVKNWATVFRELDQVIINSKWITNTREALKQTGFRDIKCTYYKLGISAIISASKP